MKYSMFSPSTVASSFLLVLLAVALPSPPAKAQQGPTSIVITPVTGAPNSFELIRVGTDEVEVGREGIRMSFSRDQIARTRNAEASQILQEADTLLGEVEKEDLSTFPNLLKEMEDTLPRIQAAARKFGWLIPEASESVAEIRQSISDVQVTLETAERLNAVAQEVERMANGTAPLAENWEESVSQALAEAERIPYLRIRKEVASRLARFKRSIRLALASKTGRTENRIRKMGADLLERLKDGSLNESRWSLDVTEMKRLAQGIPETEVREEVEQYVREIENQTEVPIRVLRERRQLAAAGTEVDSLDQKVDSGVIQPATDGTHPDLHRAVQLVAGLPESPTKQILEKRLDDVRERLAEVAATVRPATPEAPVASTASAAPPAKKALPALGSFSLIATAVAGGSLLILLIVVFAARRRKKKVVVPPGPPPAQQRLEDIFAVGSEPAQEPTVVATEEPPKRPEPEDIFGFEPGPDEDEGPDSPTAAVGADDFSPVTEDPFAIGETDLASKGPSGSLGEDLFGFGKSQPAPAEEVLPEEPQDEAPNPPPVVPPEDDLFGFGRSESQAEETGTEKAEDPSLDDDEDPLGLSIGPESSEERPQPPPSVPEDDPFGLGKPPSPEDNAFGFGSSSSGSDSISEDDLFGPLDEDEK